MRAHLFACKGQELRFADSDNKNGGTTDRLTWAEGKFANTGSRSARLLHMMKRLP